MYREYIIYMARKTGMADIKIKLAVKGRMLIIYLYVVWLNIGIDS